MDRLWRKVEKTQTCWLWRGYKDALGYGRIMMGSRTDGTRHADRPHRVAWQITYGEIPDGMIICHRCDNPTCVRPTHLFLGTHQDNMRDMTQKGRHGTRGARPGEGHHAAKLTETMVKHIRRKYAQGNVTQRVLGDEYGVSQTQIGRIVRGVRWACAV